MYYNAAIPISDAKGKIIGMPKGDSLYILFQYGQKYNRDKKQKIPLRKIIGKMHRDDPVLTYSNENYQQFFLDEILPEGLPEASRSCALRIGAYSVIRQVMQEYKLLELLGKCFDKDCGLLLNLVSYLISVREKTSLPHAFWGLELNFSVQRNCTICSKNVNGKCAS
jgi:hypothetical protein